MGFAKLLDESAPGFRNDFLVPVCGYAKEGNVEFAGFAG
jgi:hypothetical protein